MKKVIIITGASSGMGKDTAIELARQGHTVYGTARKKEELAEVEKAGVRTVAADVTNAADSEQLVKLVMEKEGRIDVLWNNAGYGLYGAVEDIPVADARRQFEVNLFGLAALTQMVLPHMRKAGKGLILNTSSMGGKIYTPLGAWYHASKHALEGWSDCLRLELKPFGIHVVLLEPGIIKTGFGDVMTGPLMHYSGNGAYSDLAGRITKATKRTYEKPGQYSETDVIVKTVSRIIASANPKTRYRAGKFAKLLVWLRIYLGDRIFDKIILSQVK